MASFNSIIRLGTLINKTFLPSRHALIPKPIAKCVFPTPGLPIKIMFSFLSIKLRLSNSLILFLVSNDI